MSYLWDKQGEADDDLKALEQQLVSARLKPGFRARPPRRWVVPLTAGLAAMAASLAALVVMSSGPSFGVTTASGVSSRLHVGRWLETTEQSTIAVADIGRVTVAASSRLRVLETSPKVHRLELAQGRLHAKVNAPPRLFVVETPAAEAVDLGCEYDLAVEPSGATRLDVRVGEVSLEGAGVSSRVSAGAMCRTVKGRAPSVPRASAASAELSAALDAWEQGGPLDGVLAAARAQDAISLWNLIARVPQAQRAAVVDRLAQLGIEGRREALLALDAKELEALWQSFP
jgi:hypothetical protein